MGSKVGVDKIAANRIGVSYSEYLKLKSSGLKWCYSCSAWKPVEEFNKDTHRGDNLSAKCRPCNYARKTSGPSKRERRLKKEIGLAWCSGCLHWLPINEVRQGKCKKHRAEYERNRYDSDINYREERYQHSTSRKRNIMKLPVEGQDILLDEFNNSCAYCHSPAETWDHITPIVKGGNTTPGNIVPCCKTCNSSKKDRNVIDWFENKGLNPNSRLVDRMVLKHAGLYG